MKTIYKYPIQIDKEHEILTVEGAEIIHIGLDPNGKPCIWCEVEIINKPEKWEIAVIGTGHTVPDGKHVGSFVDAPFMWHVYRLTNTNQNQR